MIARYLRLGTLSLSLSFSVVLASALGAPVRAADALSYDDPGMHFSAPAGWTRIERPSAPDQTSDGEPSAPAAIFVYHAGQNDQRSIVIDIQPFDGTLDAFTTHHESELHSNQDATFVDKKTKTALANGMPAYYLKISSGADAGKFKRRYEYVIFDGKRSIVVSYSGREGDFGDDDAKAALASLYVVAFPGARP